MFHTMFRSRPSTEFYGGQYIEVRNAMELRQGLEAFGCPEAIIAHACANHSYEIRATRVAPLPSNTDLLRRLNASIDQSNRESVARLGKMVESRDNAMADGDEEADPMQPGIQDDAELEEFNSAWHDTSVASWDEESGKLYTREAEDICSYDFTRNEADCIEIDRASRQVIG